MMPRPILSVDDVGKSFPLSWSLWRRMTRKPQVAVQALNGVTFQIALGETLGVVGESGCGKSTLARCLVRLYDCDSGTIRFEGQDIAGLQGAGRRQFNRRV
jgi:ABC-type oligopeptide transport system ATPase subunit